MPIQPPEMPWTALKPQSPKAAMIEEMSWARQKAARRAKDGRSMKNQPCERVMKMRACEICATWR
jgi:hypothetical protein